MNNDEASDDDPVLPHPRKIKRVASFNNNIDFTSSATVKRSRGRHNRERLERRCRHDLQRQKKISNQQQQSNALMDALKVEKYKCIFLNKTLDSTASDAAAAIEFAENKKLSLLLLWTRQPRQTKAQSSRGFEATSWARASGRT
jgi:hypothetical protein